MNNETISMLIRIDFYFLTVATLLATGMSCGCPKTTLDERSAKQEISLAHAHSSVQLPRIAVDSANRFHLAVVNRILCRMPDNVPLEVHYRGIVATDNGRRSGQRVHGNIGDPFTWTICEANNSPVCEITLTATQTQDTHLVCDILSEEFYVGVTWIRDATVSDEELSVSRDSLGGRSIRDLVQYLKVHNADVEE